MADERYALLSNLGRKITDYLVEKESVSGAADGIFDNLVCEGVCVDFFI